MKKNIAIVWGGYSSEFAVSEKSMKGIYSFLDKEAYNIFTVKINRDGWFVNINKKEYPVDKNDFSFTVDSKKTSIDFAYITIHGTPGEDGLLQGYFDMIKLPYSSCGQTASTLTFNKFICNNFLRNFGINVAKSVYLNKETKYNIIDIVDSLKLPIFIKPNTGGSSFATTKVKTIDQVQDAIDLAFAESSDVIIESFLNGREVTCGCYKIDDKETIFPITEVVTTNEFFDYNAKYLGEVEEITPANIDENIAIKIRLLTSKIYDLVGAKGIIRADFIIMEQTPYLLEINTTPGMTATSFIPQQVKAAGLNIEDVLTEIIEYELKRGL